MRLRIVLAVMCLAIFLSLSLFRNAEAQSTGLRVSADQRGFFIGAAVAMTPFRNETLYQDTLKREFNLMVAENAFKWDAVRPSQTTFNFTDTDALANFATLNNMKMRGHTLVWHNQLPGWLVNGNFTRDQTIAILRDHILTLVGRYRGTVVAWDVVNEAFEESGAFRNSFWMQRIGADYISLAFQFAREADPNAKLYYNDFNTEGMNAKSNAMFAMVRDLRAQGVQIDGVGLQMHLVNPFRVQQQHRDNFARLAGLGVDISVTELDIRIALPTTPDELQQQALGYQDVIQLCLSQPNCKAMVTWGFTDKFSWVPGTFSGQGDALIFDTNYQAKPAYTAIRGVLQQGQQPPPAPTGLTATAGNAQVALSWNPSAGAVSYNVKRSTGGAFTTIATGVTATSFTNTGLANGTAFTFVVSAVNSSGESANSNQVTATPQLPARPAAPTGLAATAGNAQVALRWNASAGATSYNVKRSTTSGGPFTTVATGVTATLFTNTGLTNGTTFFFVASAVNAGGESANSTQVSATPQTAAPPSAPSGLTASAGNAQVSLNWTASTGATSYNVKRSTTSGGPYTLVGGATGTSFTNTGLTNGTTYFFVVSALNGGGESANSSQVSATPTQPAGGVTITGSVASGSNPWWNELDVSITHTASLTALTITVTVQKTPGVAGSGQYSNYPGGVLQMSRAETASTVVYTYQLSAGQTLSAGSNRLVGSQFSGNGTAHPYTSDTFVVNYTTAGGTPQTVSGHF